MKTTPKTTTKRRRYKSLEPVWNERRQCWIVDISEKHPGNTSRKRIKISFDTREKARAHIDALNGKAESPCPAIPAPLAIDADNARKVLEPWNRSLTDAARELAAALKVLGDTGSILEAAKEFRKIHDERIASKPLGEAVTEYLESRADLRKPTLKSYSYTLGKVLADLSLTPLADIQASDIAGSLAGKGATAYRMHARNLRAFWRWASKKPRAWCRVDQLEGLESPRASTDDGDIAILKPAEVRALLEAAEAEGPEAAAAYAIAVFGGVRMAELCKLTWNDVSDDHIEIGRGIAKKHSRRLVPICATLRAWLDSKRGTATNDMQIIPPNWTDVSKSVRRRAGWNVAARLLEDPPKPTRGEWPSNAPRHTAASVQVAIGTSLDDLVFKFGHASGHDLLRAHYVGRLTKKDALAILSIGPNNTKVPVMAVA